MSILIEDLSDTSMQRFNPQESPQIYGSYNASPKVKPIKIKKNWMSSSKKTPTSFMLRNSTISTFNLNSGQNISPSKPKH